MSTGEACAVTGTHQRLLYQLPEYLIQVCILYFNILSLFVCLFLHNVCFYCLMVNKRVHIQSKTTCSKTIFYGNGQLAIEQSSWEKWVATSGTMR